MLAKAACRVWTEHQHHLVYVWSTDTSIPGDIYSYSAFLKTQTTLSRLALNPEMKFL